MKIICVDNYDREHISDVLVCENISMAVGELVVRLLNSDSGENSAAFYKLVHNDHKLYEFIP